MDSLKRQFWRLKLRLRLREISGDAFQDFFSTVMGKIHGSDYVRVRPFGAKGDKGCDGYLQATGSIFQCYGALNGGKGKVDALIEKMEEDFLKASKHLGTIMKSWAMVHNFVDGLPTDAVLALNRLAAKHPSVTLSFHAPELLEASILSLPEPDIEDLLGPAPGIDDLTDIDMKDVRMVIGHVVASTAHPTSGVTPPIKPVPQDKLEFNRIPEYWKILISTGVVNAPVIETYLSMHSDPELGERVAHIFRERYAYLKAQALSPGQIMDNLYELVTGIGSVSPSVQVAAQALIAFLFESCDIFEDAPQGVS